MMYCTMKIRIKCTQETKLYLTLYEHAYQAQVISILNHMIETGNTFYHNQLFHHHIDTHSQWHVYRIALKQYRNANLRNTCEYKKSSSWHPKSFVLDQMKLILLFGNEFEIKALQIRLSMDEYDIKKINANKIMRMDIVHDEKFWFANFTMRYASS